MICNQIRKQLVCCIAILSTLLFSCQKELEDTQRAKIWALQKIKITNKSTGKNIAEYSFEYDSVSMKPSQLSFIDANTNNSKSIFPVYSKDSIYLGDASFIKLDKSGKVVFLKELKTISNNSRGDYYYVFNNQNRIFQRLLDTGVGDASRMNFNYNGDTLLGYNTQGFGLLQPEKSVFTYSQSVVINNFKELALVELFPELLMYLPCIKLGILPKSPVLSSANIVEGNMTYLPPKGSSYSNYVVDSDGLLQSFEVSTVVNNQKTIHKKYEFKYMLM